MNATEKSYKTFTVPETCSNRPSLGCSLSWDHWCLPFCSSSLDPVSSISFKGFSKNGFGPSRDQVKTILVLESSAQAQGKGTLGPRTILHSRLKIIAPIQQEVAREIQRPFSHFFYDFRVWNERVFLARKQNRTLGPSLMLQAGCIYLGLITPLQKPSTPYTFPKDLSPAAQLQMPSQLKYTQNIPPD